MTQRISVHTMHPENNENTSTSTNASITTTSAEAGWDIEELSPRQLRVVLVCDVVESVRWMEHDEDNAITRWSQFANAVRSRIAPEHKGSVVKTTGDGLMLEFGSAPQAVAAANAMQKLCAEGNAGYAGERQMHLRVGIHQAQVRRDAHDLYGHGVNLAARISTLAGPGEIIVTPEVRDHLTDSLDGDIEDMGECYLKHLSEPQRVYRVGFDHGVLARAPVQLSVLTIEPSVAVLPFTPRWLTTQAFSVSDLIVDSVIVAVSRTPYLRVISKYSSQQLWNRENPIENAKSLLNAQYVVAGSFALENDRLTVWFEITDTVSSRVLIADIHATSLNDLLQPHSEIGAIIAGKVNASILRLEAQNVSLKPLPNLASHSLLLAAIQLIQRNTFNEFKQGRTVLDELMLRHPRSAWPKTWLANWHIFQFVQGWHDDIQSSSKQAYSLANQSVDLDPDNSFALAVKGLVQAYMQKDLDNAAQSYEQALMLNPNESLALICSATLLSYQTRGKEAEILAEKALTLVPINQDGYFYKSLASTAILSAGNYSRAIELATLSLKANKKHASTYRSLAIAQVLNGDEASAKETISQLLHLDPKLTTSLFLERYPGRDASHAQTYAQALRVAGLPN